MKILIVGDIHIAPTSSIVKNRGEKFTLRLENCIKSINWCEKIAKENNCDLEVFLGDTFDKPNLDQETITAIRDIKWNSISKYMIIGNHESAESDLAFSSTNVFNSSKIKIINNIHSEMTENDTELLFLPYITENNRADLDSYTNKLASKRIIFSHNDISGIQLGPIISKTGFKVEDILNNCDMFINGHLHNGTWVKQNRIRNLGILTGANFGEDADKYPHNIMILDTDTMTYTDIENPFAFNFYNITVNSKIDFDKFSKLKTNSVVSVKCNDDLVIELHELIDNNVNIICSRVVIQHIDHTETDTQPNITDLRVDHLQKLIEFCKEKIDYSQMLEIELQEICK